MNRPLILRIHADRSSSRRSSKSAATDKTQPGVIRSCSSFTAGAWNRPTRTLSKMRTIARPSLNGPIHVSTLQRRTYQTPPVGYSDLKDRPLRLSSNGDAFETYSPRNRFPMELSRYSPLSSCWKVQNHRIHRHREAKNGSFRTPSAILAHEFTPHTDQDLKKDSPPGASRVVVLSGIFGVLEQDWESRLSCLVVTAIREPCQ